MDHKTRVAVGAVVRIGGIALGAIILGFGLALLMALPVMLLWNWLVPEITKGALTGIGFWQAFGVNFICGLLFRGSNSSK